MPPSAPAPLPEAPTRLDVRLLAFLLSAYIGMVIAANLGSVLAPTLVNDQPALLLALSSRNRHLLLTVAADINPIAYWLIGAARLMVAAWVSYLLGQNFGERGLSWIERQSNGQLPSTFVWLEKAADRAGAPLVVLMPGSNVVAALVGMRGMTAPHFGLLISVGIVIRLATFWFLGQIFEEPLDKLLDWIDRYQWWLVGAFFLLSVLTSFRKSTRQRSTRP
jgi:membrane protein DedA with SNARE-associated domain